MVDREVLYVDGLDFDYADSGQSPAMIARRLRQDSLSTTLPLQCADPASIGNQLPSDSCYLVSTANGAAHPVGEGTALLQFMLGIRFRR